MLNGHYYYDKTLPLLPYTYSQTLAIQVFGETFGSNWFFHPYTPDWLQYHISVREFLLIVIVIALEMWSSYLKKSTIVPHSDNLAVVQIIKKTKGSQTINETFNGYVLTHDIHFYAKHIQGVANVAADLLHRLEVSEFKTRFPHMDKEQTPVSLSLVRI